MCRGEFPVEIILDDLADGKDEYNGRRYDSSGGTEIVKIEVDPKDLDREPGEFNPDRKKYRRKPIPRKEGNVQILRRTQIELGKALDVYFRVVRGIDGIGIGCAVAKAISRIGTVADSLEQVG